MLLYILSIKYYLSWIPTYLITFYLKSYYLSIELLACTTYTPVIVFVSLILVYFCPSFIFLFWSWSQSRSLCLFPTQLSSTPLQLPVAKFPFYLDFFLIFYLCHSHISFFPSFITKSQPTFYQNQTLWYSFKIDSNSTCNLVASNNCCSTHNNRQTDSYDNPNYLWWLHFW